MIVTNFDDNGRMALESGAIFSITEPSYDDLLEKSFELWESKSTAERHQGVEGWLRRNREIEMPQKGDDLNPKEFGFDCPLSLAQYGEPGRRIVTTLAIYPNLRYKAVVAVLVEPCIGDWLDE